METATYIIWEEECLLSEKPSRFTTDIQNVLDNKIPDGFISYANNWTEGYYGTQGIVVWKNNKRFVYKHSTKEVIDRIVKLQHPSLPNIVWHDETDYIRDYIEGTAMNGYYQCMYPSTNWLKWYVIENYYIWKQTGGHGDFIPNNVIITPSMEIKWIDVNVGDSLETFLTMLPTHFNNKVTREEIEVLLGL